MPWNSSPYDYYDDEDPVTWTEHFAKGLASMGVLGFLKALLASPLQFFRIGGGRGRNTARDRYEQVSWIIIVIGVGTFLLVCVAIPALGYLGLLTYQRPSTKGCEHGVAVHSKRQAKESWTYKVTMMTMATMTSSFSRCVLLYKCIMSSRVAPIILPLLARYFSIPHTLKLHRFFPLYRCG